jgi:hypothetical protein
VFPDPVRRPLLDFKEFVSKADKATLTMVLKVVPFVTKESAEFPTLAMLEEVRVIAPSTELEVFCRVMALELK